MNLNLKINKRRLLKEVKRDLIEREFRKSAYSQQISKSKDSSRKEAHHDQEEQTIKIPHERLKQTLEIRVLIEKIKRIRQIKRELDVMHRCHRKQQLGEKNSFQVINKKPEVRFQVQRQSQRQIAHNKLMIQDKTKDQFRKLKKMKQMLLAQQSRIMTEKSIDDKSKDKKSPNRSQMSLLRRYQNSNTSRSNSSDQENEGGSQQNNTNNSSVNKSPKSPDELKVNQMKN